MLDPPARRLIVASALRLHAARVLGTGPLGADLLAAAGCLRPTDDRLARIHGLTFTPDYPGGHRGVEEVRGGTRLVLTCRAARWGEPAATVITTLIRGRPAQITAAPP